jgi:exopolysaccharide biosynthesis polyprenyl glycosylphosphotransferase
MTANTIHSVIPDLTSIQPLNPLRLKWLLLLGDSLGVLACFGLSLWLRLGQSIKETDLVLIGLVGLVLMGLYLADAYNLEVKSHRLQQPLRICLSSLLVGGVSAILIYLSGFWGQDALLGRGILLPSLALGTGWSIGLRFIARNWLQSQSGQSRWLLLGTGQQALNFSHDFHQHTVGKLLTLSHPIVEPTAANHLIESEFNREFNCVGTLSDLSTWSRQPWSGVVMDNPTAFSEEHWQLLRQLRLAGTPIYHLADFYELFWQKLPSATLGDTWFTLSQGFQLRMGRFSWKLKRLVDLVAAIMMSVLLAPLMLFTALAIRLDSPGPIFYSQVRSGWNGQPFKVYKFRSMHQDAEARGAQWAQERDPRITRVGYWLRILRIDELPQIWNVLCGEMSLIGPRPERPEFDTKLKEVIPYYELRYLVKPGITGWAQVMYPYGASIQDSYEKLAYDLYYIKNYSIWLDVVIVLKTIRVVLLGKGR